MSILCKMEYQFLRNTSPCAFIVLCLCFNVITVQVLGIEPTFDVPIVNVTVVAGQTALLPCSIESLGKYKVAWLDQNNMPLTYDDRRVVDDFRFSVVRPYLKEWNLQIRDIQWADQGQYRCTINTQPPKSKNVVLHVKVPAHIIDELSSSDETVQEGDTVVLVCNVTGVPRPEVTWYRRPANSKLHERESKKCKPRTVGPGIGHVGEVIIIQNVSRYCDDIYECVADNGVPPAVSRQMRVTVEFAPEITLQTRRIGQERGKDTIVECKITAYPQANNYWEKNGYELTSTSGKYRVQPYDEGNHVLTLSLRIHDLETSDFGEYRCVARNSLGVDSESMWVYEYRPPTIENHGGPVKDPGSEWTIVNPTHPSYGPSYVTKTDKSPTGNNNVVKPAHVRSNQATQTVPQHPVILLPVLLAVLPWQLNILR